MGYQPPLASSTSAAQLVCVALLLLVSAASTAEAPPQRRAGSWCASEDAGARAYSAAVVFEGKARSKSPVGPGGIYYVTFVVERVFKDSAGGAGGGLFPERLLKARQVRLPFVAVPPLGPPPLGPPPLGGPPLGPPLGPPKASRCEDMARLRTPPTSVVRANLKQGGRFIVFADRMGSHNLTVRGPPMPRTRSSLQAISAVLCPTCVLPPGIWGLRNRSVTARRKLRLKCHTSGSPSPVVTWMKNGRRISSTRKRMTIVHQRKRSTLTISRVRLTDAGVYECRAVSVTGESALAKAVITVFRPPSGHQQTGRRPPPKNGSSEGKGPLDSQPCKTESYCLHGGKCKYFATIGEQVCECADGYKGRQCESKDVTIQPSEALSIQSWWWDRGQ